MSERKRAKTHAIERTSPLGGPFIGTCWQCGKTGLKMGDALEPCENLLGDTPDDALLRAIDGGRYE
jgi:hypothetical protein